MLTLSKPYRSQPGTHPAPLVYHISQNFEKTLNGPVSLITNPRKPRRKEHTGSNYTNRRSISRTMVGVQRRRRERKEREQKSSIGNQIGRLITGRKGVEEEKKEGKGPIERQWKGNEERKGKGKKGSKRVV